MQLRVARRFSNVVGIDDAPFERTSRGDVPVVGVVFAAHRLDGLLTTKIRRDGVNSTAQLIAMLNGSRFRQHLHAVLLQGIALGGFNVVDLHGLHRALGLPVLVVARRQPNLERIRSALLAHVPGGLKKWKLIESAGKMESTAGVWVQRAGISREDAAALIRQHRIHGSLPEPIRVAHLIAGGMTTGESRGGA